MNGEGLRQIHTTGKFVKTTDWPLGVWLKGGRSKRVDSFTRSRCREQRRRFCAVASQLTISIGRECGDPRPARVADRAARFGFGRSPERDQSWVALARWVFELPARVWKAD
jgi:hypothetical protein